MWRKITIAIAAFIFAVGILITSILRTAAVRYDFADAGDSKDQQNVLGESDVHIEYNFAYHGRVLPDHPLWPVKALRDKVWLIITTNDSRKAELLLLFADKRASSALVLFERGKYELGYETLTKAEKYLEAASNNEEENRKKGINTSEFLVRLEMASLKHYQNTEKMLEMAPEDAKPGIVQVQHYSKSVYEKARDALMEKGRKPPENPFEWN
jgi:hypothetical protein